MATKGTVRQVESDPVLVKLTAIEEQLDAISTRLDEAMKIMARPVRSNGRRFRNDDDSPKLITSKYNGRCAVCGEFYDAGDKVYWVPGQKGASHEGCGVPE